MKIEDKKEQNKDWIYGVGESGFNCWGLDASRLCYSCYMSVSGMHLRPLLSSQPLTLPAPWILLRVTYSLTV